MKNNFADRCWTVVACAVASAIVGFLLNCVVFPIGYLMVHDCGRWICEHNYPMTWGSYSIVTGVTFIVLCVIALVAEGAGNASSVGPSRRSGRSHDGALETDYYDSDMEGAPGYNGFE